MGIEMQEEENKLYDARASRAYNKNLEYYKQNFSYNIPQKELSEEIRKEMFRLYEDNITKMFSFLILPKKVYNG